MLLYAISLPPLLSLSCISTAKYLAWWHCLPKFLSWIHTQNTHDLRAPTPTTSAANDDVEIFSQHFLFEKTRNAAPPGGEKVSETIELIFSIGLIITVTECDGRKDGRKNKRMGLLYNITRMRGSASCSAKIKPMLKSTEEPIFTYFGPHHSQTLDQAGISVHSV